MLAVTSNALSSMHPTLVSTMNDYWRQTIMRAVIAIVEMVNLRIYYFELSYSKGYTTFMLTNSSGISEYNPLLLLSSFPSSWLGSLTSEAP